MTRRIQVELAILYASDERFPLCLREVQLTGIGGGGIAHHVELGLACLVRSGRGMRGDIHLDSAALNQLSAVGWAIVTSIAVHRFNLALSVGMSRITSGHVSLEADHQSRCSGKLRYVDLK